MSVNLLIEFNLEFLSLTGGCISSSESTPVKKAHCWKSHFVVQMISTRIWWWVDMIELY